MVKNNMSFGLILFLVFSNVYNAFHLVNHKSTEVILRKSNNFILSMSSTGSTLSPRVQRIKDISLQKEILMDITASEFALRVETEQPDAIIDFERLISNLDRHLIVLETRKTLMNNTSELINRINIIQEDLNLASNNLPLKHMKYKANKKVIKPAKDSNLSVKLTVESENSTTVQDIASSLRILVREDGSVDWDGAIDKGREVAKFGSELWERLNGKDKDGEFPSFNDLLSLSTAKLIESPEIKQLAEIVAITKTNVQTLEAERDNLKVKLRNNRRNGINIVKEDVQELKRLDLRVKELQKRCKLFTLNLDMEKICFYVQQELEAATDPSDQRMIIAEVTLIDKQLSMMMAGLDMFARESGLCNVLPTTNEPKVENEDLTLQTANPLTRIETNLNSLDEEKLNSFMALIDDDELNLVSSEIIDLKSRLGIEAALVPAFDWGSIGVVATETIQKIKVGLSYFGEGTRVLVSDLQYAWIMLKKAAKGKTLKPREVNAIRRTAKDLLTLIPFTIILIIPLSPIGHVLVFTFIQKYFPEFYPSCYTEKRLNLRKLFSSVERKKDDDLLGNDELPSLLNWPKVNGPLLTPLTNISETAEKIKSSFFYKQILNNTEK